ncbi:hypothetical protein [Streptomyces spectabilis]|uniref:hypothetical protein n=1 Tax=Streptomyces spectabilis TaxID=68270 RepID=UPI003405E8EF
MDVFSCHPDGSLTPLCRMDSQAGQNGVHQWRSAAGPQASGISWEQAAAAYVEAQHAHLLPAEADFVGFTMLGRTSTDAADAAKRFRGALARELDLTEAQPGPLLLCHLGQQAVYFACLDHPSLGRVMDMGIDPTQPPIIRVTQAQLNAHSAAELLSGLHQAVTAAQTPRPQAEMDAASIKRAALRLEAAVKQARHASHPHKRFDALIAQRNATQTALQSQASPPPPANSGTGVGAR